MGIEIVFDLIIPVALVCLALGVWRWRSVGEPRGGGSGARLSAYLPLAFGLLMALAGLSLTTYVLCDADFTDLVRQGHYAEAERAIYLPRRVVGQLIVNLVFALPIIAFIIIPWTCRVVADRRLSLATVGLRVAMAWSVISALALLAGLGGPWQRFDPLVYAAVVAMPFFMCGLPIPLMAKWWFGSDMPADAVPAQ